MPRSLQIEGAVRGAALHRLNVSSGVCETLRTWNFPADVFVTPHGAQLNNRFLMQQQPQPCLVEVFPVGSHTTCRTDVGKVVPCRL